MIRKIKKGFTLVELVVVIAIIAILAGVSIAAYVGISQSAKKSADDSVLSQLNLQLKAKNASEGKNRNCYEAYLDAKEIGFDLKLMTPQAGGFYAWNQEEDLFSVLGTEEAEDANSYKLWKFVKEVSQSNFSQFLTDDTFTGPVNVIAGFDAGDNRALTSVSYTGGSTAKDVIIRTNSGNLTVDAEKETVNHYGHTDSAFIKAVNTVDCYHEYGSVNQLKIGKGKFILEQTAFISTISKIEGSEPTIQNNGAYITKSEIPEVEESEDYGINSVAKLDELRKHVADGADFEDVTIKLTADLDLSGTEWAPIGTQNHYFSGSFDGNGKTISNLTIKNGEKCNALFGYTDDVEISNLTLSNVSIEGKEYCAGLVAIAKGNTNISNCTVSGTIKTAGQFAAGFVCDLSEGNTHSLSKLTNNASVTVESAYDNKPAGIVSQTHGDVTLSECVNNGAIVATNEELGFAGGLVSMVQTGSLDVTGCVNNGTVTGNKAGKQISLILNGGGLIEVKVDSASAIGYINRHNGTGANSFNVFVGGVSYYGRFDGSMHSFEEAFNRKKTLDTTMFDTFRAFCRESGFATEAGMDNFEIFDLPFQSNSVNRRNYIYGNASDTDTSWDYKLSQYNNNHPGNEISKETFKVTWNGNVLYQLDK